MDFTSCIPTPFISLSLHICFLPQQRMGSTNSPTLVTLGQALPPATGCKGQGNRGGITPSPNCELFLLHNIFPLLDSSSMFYHVPTLLVLEIMSLIQYHKCVYVFLKKMHNSVIDNFNFQSLNTINLFLFLPFLSSVLLCEILVYGLCLTTTA